MNHSFSNKLWFYLFRKMLEFGMSTQWVIEDLESCLSLWLRNLVGSSFNCHKQQPRVKLAESWMLILSEPWMVNVWFSQFQVLFDIFNSINIRNNNIPITVVQKDLASVSLSWQEVSKSIDWSLGIDVVSDVLSLGIRNNIRMVRSISFLSTWPCSRRCGS